MKLFFTLVLGAISPIASASVDLQLNHDLGPKSIEAILASCERHEASDQNPRVKTLLNHLMTKYSDRESRVSDPKGYLQAINRVIAASPFQPIIQCEDRLNRLLGTTFEIVYIDPNAPSQRMSVGYFDQKNPQTGLTRRQYALFFSLKAPAPQVFFTYLHEMTHVCQAIDKNPLIDEFNAAKDQIRDIYDQYISYENTHYPDSLDAGLLARFRTFDAVSGKLYRSKMIGEVESFLSMVRAFAYFAPMSPQICRIGPSPDGDMYQEYIHSIEDLAAGIFAQGIVESYWNYYKGFHARPEFFFQPGSVKIHYKFHSPYSSEIDLPFLSPELKTGLEALGIQVRESGP